MLRRCLMAFMIIVIAGSASSVSADIGDLAYEKVQALVATGQNYGNTAGTILNPEGRGDALIFPYYDVREVLYYEGVGKVYGKPQAFLFTITNNDGDCEGPYECNAGIAARLRFREAERGEEVFSTDIWLSPGDVWVGVITHNTSLPFPYGARITSPDWVITDFSADSFSLGTPYKEGYDFPTTAYIPHLMYPPFYSSNLMGYFEVIGQERTNNHQKDSKVTRLTGNADAPNRLMGAAYIVRVADGSSLGYNATAIANFSRNKGSLFSGLNSPSPTLMDCEDTLDQLEFQLSKKEVFAGYSTELSINAEFSLILTFPTKNFHFCGNPDYAIKGDPAAPCPATYPLGPPFRVERVKRDLGGSDCGEGYPIGLTIFDRAGNRLIPSTCFVGSHMSCRCPDRPNGLFSTVNVTQLFQGPSLPVWNGGIVGSRGNSGLPTGPVDSGLIGIAFGSPLPNVGHVQSLNPKITKFLHYDMPFSAYEGLPVIGVALQEFSNFNVGGFYGDTRDVFYKTKWVP